jgi:hypothetical protein|tara:strand:+ start:146 stop:616 length:471 start_codon:yes stop_codon:yes gene_type:complete
MAFKLNKFDPGEGTGLNKQNQASSPTKIIPFVLGALTVADLAYQGYKYYKGRKDSKTKEEVKSKIAAMTPEQRKRFYNKIKGKLGGKSGGTKVGQGVAASGKKVSGGSRTWGQGQAASGGNLNALVAQRKGLKKGTPEYAAVQNKINAALGSKKRH